MRKNYINYVFLAVGVLIIGFAGFKFYEHVNTQPVANAVITDATKRADPAVCTKPDQVVERLLAALDIDSVQVQQMNVPQTIATLIFFKVTQYGVPGNTAVLIEPLPENKGDLPPKEKRGYMLVVAPDGCTLSWLALTPRGWKRVSEMLALAPKA